MLEVVKKSFIEISSVIFKQILLLLKEIGMIWWKRGGTSFPPTSLPPWKNGIWRGIEVGGNIVFCSFEDTMNAREDSYIN